MPRGMEITINSREVSPCKGCKERFTACHDNCPKDARGEYGYKAWAENVERTKDERKKYDQRYFRKHHSY